MLCKAIRHTLSALAAIALFSAFASSAVAGETGHFLGLDHSLANKETGEKANPEGLATRSSPRQTTTTHYPIRWFQGYSGGGR